jgi:oligopeptidase B
MFLPYLDRGMIYAIAHVRGGGEMGRFWYEEQGKYLNKRNTFMDFVSCAEHLVDSGYTAPSLLAAEGRSAGGLLVGNVLNWRPDLFEARRDPSWPHAAPRTALAARLRSLSWRH